MKKNKQQFKNKNPFDIYRYLNKNLGVEKSKFGDDSVLINGFVYQRDELKKIKK